MAVTLAAALAFLALKPSPWTAEATVAVEPGTAVVGGDVRQDDISYLERLVNTYATLGASRDVREGVARRVDLPQAPEVQVTPVPSTNLMTVKATTPDARSAARAADAVADELIEQVRKSSADAVKAAESSFMRRRAALEADIAQASVQLDSSRGSGDRTAERQLRERIESDRASLDAQRDTYENYQAGREARAGSISLVTPALHATKASRGVEQVIVIALLLGGVAAAGLAFVAENLSGSFRTRAELEASVDSLVLAAIPRVSGASRDATFNGGSQAEEAFRRLRTNFLLQVREDVQTVLVTSADPGEGKTTVVANLGRSLAQSGRSVVLVDADLRAPRLHEFFGELVAPGLGDVLSASPDSRMPSEGRSSNGKAAEAGLLRRITHALRRESGEMRRTDLAATVGHASNGGTFTRALKLGVSTGVLATTGRGTYQLVDRSVVRARRDRRPRRPPDPERPRARAPPCRAVDRRSRHAARLARHGAAAQGSSPHLRLRAGRLAGRSRRARRARHPIQRRRRPAGRWVPRAARRASSHPRRARTRRGAAHGDRPEQRERPWPLPVRHIPVAAPR